MTYPLIISNFELSSKIGCTSGKKKNGFFFGISVDLHYLCGKIGKI